MSSSVSAEIDVNAEYPFFCTLNEDIAASIPYPRKIPIQGHLIYLRKEFEQSSFIKKKKDIQAETPLIGLLLSMQEALLGKVTPALRIVSVDVNAEEKGLYFYFEYDSPISDENRNLANLAIQEASASFPGYTIHSYIQPVGKQTRRGIRVAYSRRESND